MRSYEAVAPLRALDDAHGRIMVTWGFDRSSFALELSVAVEKVAVCRGRIASTQSSDLIPTFFTTAHH